MQQDISNFLIIEKDAKQAEIYSGFIREVTNAKIDVVPHGDLALEKLATQNYQVIILDTISTRDTGASLERYKGIHPNTSILIVSSQGSITEAVQMMRLGGEDYFPKPVSPDQFKLAVRRCLDRGALYTGDDQVVRFLNLINACQVVSASLDESRVFEAVMRFVRRETRARGMALYRREGEKWARVPTSSDSDVDVIDVALEVNQALDKTLEDKMSCRQCSRSMLTPELLLFHFKWASDQDYFVVCASPESGVAAEDIFSRYKLLQVQVQLTARNIQNYLSVRDMLYRDDATSLHNFRYLKLSLDKAFDGHIKQGKKFAVLFVDLDRFKSVNDGHGHMIGTKLLNEVGTCLKKETRPDDILCRYGGDEFVIILNNVDIQEARAIAERMRQNVELNIFLKEEGHFIKLTVSIGVALCPDHAKTRDDILAAADHAMYVVKKTTKNQVFVYDSQLMNKTPKKAA